MRFNVDRICELAGLGAASGGLISEAAGQVPAAKQAPAKPTMPAAKPAAPAAKPAMPAAKPAAMEMNYMDEDDDDFPGDYLYDVEEEDVPSVVTPGDILEDDAMYDIDEMDLAEALIGMRQQRLEEASVRDTVRNEIQRALEDRSGSWVYGSNRPTASRVGQVSRGGFGIGFRR